MKKKNNTDMKMIFKIFTVVLGSLAAVCMNTLSAQSVQIGDLITFPDGSQGIVCHVNQNNSGWVVDLEDLDGTYKILESVPSTTDFPMAPSDYNYFSLSSWTPMGLSNTQTLESMGSPAAQAVGLGDGWYIPDAEQMMTLVGLVNVLQPAFDRAGKGNISNIVQYNRDYWTSSRTPAPAYFYFFRLRNNSLNQSGQLYYDNPTAAHYIRRVRDFDQSYNMKAYWTTIAHPSVIEINSDTTTITVSPDQIGDYDYKAEVVFNTDTFKLTGVLGVVKCCELTLNVDSVADEVCGGDGVIFVSTKLGTAPIKFSIDGGTTWKSDSVFRNLAAGNHQIIAVDVEDCTDTIDAVVAPHPVPVITVTCPPDVSDTLAFGDCVMNIYPDRLGKATFLHSLDWPMDTSNNIPADYLFQEGETIITWVFTDKCGNKDSCEQKVTIVFPQCPDAVDCEGNVYKGVRIGCDCWTQRNLISTQYSAGGTCTEEIPCIYEYESDMYPDAAANVDIFGKLYCFEAAIGDSTDNGYGHIQGICPEGWYLPTPEKYAALHALGAAALKSPDYWIDGGGNNSTEFTWLPAGRWNGEFNRFDGLMSEGYFWATEDTGSKVQAKVIYLRYACDETYIMETSTGNAYSVRCIKEKGNSNTTTPTDAQPCPGTPTVLDHEGNKYNTVQIGTQCWMKENMRCTTSPNGYLTAGDNNTISYTDPLYYNYTESTIPLNERGLLYNWAAAMDTVFAVSEFINFANRRGICPAGWHIPSDAEWTTLSEYVKSQADYICGSNDDNIGKALASEKYWAQPTNNSTEECLVGYDILKNNATGFSAVPACYRINQISPPYFSGEGYYNNVWFWSSSSANANSSVSYYLHSDNYFFNIYSTDQKNYGISVRCLKDS